MFEWITKMEYEIDFEGADGYIAKFNPDTKKFNVENENGEKIGEVDIFESGINWNIDQYNDWTDKLYTALIRNNGKITLNVYSTENNNGDSWDIEIYRHKTLLPTHEFSEQIILTNYIIVCNDEIQGDILTRRHKLYSGCAIDEQKEFDNWIEEQMEKVSQFNNENHWEIVVPAIIVCDGLCDKEEENLLHEMFGDKLDRMSA